MAPGPSTAGEQPVTGRHILWISHEQRWRGGDRWPGDLTVNRPHHAGGVCRVCRLSNRRADDCGVPQGCHARVLYHRASPRGAAGGGLEPLPAARREARPGASAPRRGSEGPQDFHLPGHCIRGSFLPQVLLAFRARLGAKNLSRCFTKCLVMASPERVIYPQWMGAFSGFGAGALPELGPFLTGCCKFSSRSPEKFRLSPGVG